MHGWIIPPALSITPQVCRHRHSARAKKYAYALKFLRERSFVMPPVSGAAAGFPGGFYARTHTPQQGLCEAQTEAGPAPVEKVVPQGEPSSPKKRGYRQKASVESWLHPSFHHGLLGLATAVTVVT